MKQALTLIAAVAATPVLAHPSVVPHEHHGADAFSLLAAAIALALVAATVVAIPYARAALSRVKVR